jgi:hypothetical protein
MLVDFWKIAQFLGKMMMRNCDTKKMESNSLSANKVAFCLLLATKVAPRLLSATKVAATLPNPASPA